MSHIQRNQLWKLFEMGRDHSNDLQSANAMIETILLWKDVPTKITFPAQKIRSDGNQIQFIKVLREATGYGLADAKALSEKGELSGNECTPAVVQWLHSMGYL